MPTYALATKDVITLLEECLTTFHPDLVEASVTFSVLMASPAKEGGPCLVLHGDKALAIIKITSVDNRVAGMPDLLLKIDQDAWDERDDAERIAILDHECEHVVLQREDDGTLKEDDAGRPKMKLKGHDIIVGGFEAVVKRHQQFAAESHQYLDAHKKFSQACFPWG